MSVEGYRFTAVVATCFSQDKRVKLRKVTSGSHVGTRDRARAHLDICTSKGNAISDAPVPPVIRIGSIPIDNSYNLWVCQTGTQALEMSSAGSVRVLLTWRSQGR
jgi:hypothetical protein